MTGLFHLTFDVFEILFNLVCGCFVYVMAFGKWIDRLGSKLNFRDVALVETFTPTTWSFLRNVYLHFDFTGVGKHRNAMISTFISFFGNESRDLSRECVWKIESLKVGTKEMLIITYMQRNKIT